MKGKNIFTNNEIEQIKNLTRRKISASSSEQKQIRNRIRSIGFYYSDFSSSKGYDVNDIELLIRNGEIQITNIDERSTKSETSESGKPISKERRNNQKNKTNKPLIVNEVIDLFQPIYGLEPLVDDNVKYLILGTFPARESIEKKFYYQNQSKRFWGQALLRFGSLEYKTNPERKEVLLKNNVGLWDIFECVQRKGGNQDSAIEKAKYNYLENFINDHPSINYIIFNGKNAKIWLEDDHPEFFNDPELKFIRLQSTSGLNGWFNDGKDWNEFFNSVFK